MSEQFPVQQYVATTTIPHYQSAQTQLPTAAGNSTAKTKANGTVDVFKPNGKLCQGGLSSVPGATLEDTSQGACRAFSKASDFLQPQTIQ